MKDAQTDKPAQEDVETTLLDVELFLKYQAPKRAIARLTSAIKSLPHSIPLREKLREVAAAHSQPDEAARQCLALANLYITREDFETAQERLIEAKHFDQRINIASGLEAIRRARNPHLLSTPSTIKTPSAVAFAGDLSVISIFDAVQVVENARLTGALIIISAGGDSSSRLLFNEGQIVGAERSGLNAQESLLHIIGTTDGSFEFERAARPPATTIHSASNTSLLLDTLRELDEGKATSSR